MAGFLEEGGRGGNRKCRKDMNHPKRSLGRLNTGTRVGLSFTSVFFFFRNALIVMADSSLCRAASQVSECERMKPLVLFLRESSKPTQLEDIKQMKT